MCETLQKGDEIMTLQATDKDSDDSALIYALDDVWISFLYFFVLF